MAGKAVPTRQRKDSTMSWQANECLVGTVEYKDYRFQGQMLEAMKELLWLYEENGAGWYLLGYFDGDTKEEDAIICEEKEGISPEWRSMWLPNPFMHPYVSAYKLRNMSDLMGVAFECADNDYDTIAYAGDGDEPLERMTISGKTYDMRAA